MPAFPKSTFSYDYGSTTRSGRCGRTRWRGRPRRGAGRTLVATWNLPNFGLQKRRGPDRQLIAEILSWFDLVAVQVVRDNFADLEDVCRMLGGGWRMLFSDVAGNDENPQFIQEWERMMPLEAYRCLTRDAFVVAGVTG